MEDDQSPPESIALELESDETPSDEGTEEDEQAVSDIDVEDLFEDEEVSNDD